MKIDEKYYSGYGSLPELVMALRYFYAFSVAGSSLERLIIIKFDRKKVESDSKITIQDIELRAILTADEIHYFWINDICSENGDNIIDYVFIITQSDSDIIEKITAIWDVDFEQEVTIYQDRKLNDKETTIEWNGAITVDKLRFFSKPIEIFAKLIQKHVKYEIGKHTYCRYRYANPFYTPTPTDESSVPII